MSDENEHEHEHHNHPIFAMHMGPPPEVIERMRMEGEANAHETREFLESLTEDQLRKFSAMMGIAASSQGVAGTYYMGVAAAILDWKFKSCLACGKNHDKPFEEMTQSSESTQKTPSPDENDPLDWKPPGARECCTTLEGKAHLSTCNLMIQYNVEPDDDGSEHVMCKGCGTWLMSLEDRMLRQPGKGGCATCVQKEKWG